MYVCLFEFSSVDTAGNSWEAIPILLVERELKDQGGDYEASIRFTCLGGLKSIRLLVTDSVGRWLSVQDARMSFHICIVGY